MAWGESNLLSLGVEVLWVPVEGELSDLLEWVVGVRPDLGDVVNVESVLGGVSNWHHLNVKGPRWEVAVLDGVEKIGGREVLVLHSHLGGLLGSEVLDSLIGLEVVLDPEGFTGGIDPLEGVRTVSIHVAITNGGSTVRHEDGDLVESLRRVGPEVPGHLSALNTSLRVSLLRVNEIRELDWVLDEENWSVVSDDIVVSLFGVELDSETSWIPIAIVGSALASDSGEAKEAVGLLADSLEEVGLGPPGQTALTNE